jgi:endonuclease/exonuclease/phosphatase family metal-dependent hydrolase
MRRITLMTYNVYSGRTLDGRYDLGGKIEAIHSVSPDILGLNEVHLNTIHSGGTSQTEIFAQSLGYRYSYFARSIYHDGGEYGISLLTRFPILECATVPIPETPCGEGEKSFEPRVIINAVVDAGGERIHVMTSHYGLTGAEQTRAVAETLRLSELDMPAVFMGDLNAEPDDPVLGPLFKRFCDTAAGLSRSDTLTFRSDAPDRRIDYIFVSRHFRVLGSRVLPVTASDHRPVAAEAELTTRSMQ